jgi:hypothetical protein
MEVLLDTLLVTIFFVTLFLSRHQVFNKQEQTTVIPGGPYRTVATMPQEPEPQPIKQSKPKREFKMPSITLGKYTKTFGFILPVCGAAIGIGTICDSNTMGLGTKWGTSIALAIIGIFFFVLTLIEADKDK